MDRTDSYLLGTQRIPLMDGAEEIDRATRIRNLRLRMWRCVLELKDGPRATLETLRELDHEAADKLGSRLRRLARSARRTQRSIGPMIDDLLMHDEEGILSSTVIDRLLEADDSDPEVLALVELQDAWRREKHHFVLANLGLVFKVAGRFKHANLTLHDLVQDGCLGLMRAVDMYDPDKGFRFSTYAVWWIRHAIGRALADRARTIRVPVHLVTLQTKLKRERKRLSEELGREATTAELAEACGVTPERVRLADQAFSATTFSLDQPRPGETEPPDLPDDDPTEMLDDQIVAGALPGLVDQLDRMEADVLRKRFGLEETEPMTLQEIGNEYALSRERIRQIELKALQKMREVLGVA